MADPQSIAGRQGLPDDAYSVGEFAKRYRLDDAEARRIIDQHGSSRERLDAYMAARTAE
jgi:hypothetical protein